MYMYKTAVYTLVKGVIRTHQKQQISKKVILLSSTLTLIGDVMLRNVTFFDICCF